MSEKKLMAMTQYLCQATISNYHLSNSRKLGLLLFVDSEHWRAHEKQTFGYKTGAWIKQERLSISPGDLFTALEGLFITMGDRGVLDWSWDAVAPKLEDIIAEFKEKDVDPFTWFCQCAKDSGGHLRRKTENKVWKGDWPSRVADLILHLKKQWGSAYCVSVLSKLFLQVCETYTVKQNIACIGYASVLAICPE